MSSSSAEHATTETSINLPQLLVLTLLGFLAIRWLLSSRSPSPSPGRNANANRINPAHVDQMLTMFPQFDRRTIMWELQRNGGSVQIATEKVLTGRGLERPPQTYQPPMPASTAARPAPAQPKSSHPDLITKYNLTSRLNDSPSDSDASIDSKGKKAAWSSNKEERQSMLQKRREEMILAARRKMEEQDRLAKEGKS